MTVKYPLLCLLAFFTLSGTAFAQKQRRKNAFDTTLAKKHELVIAPGFTLHDFQNNSVSIGGPTAASLNIEYARVFKANHFLRSGVRFAAGSSGGNKTLEFPAKSVTDPGYPGGPTITYPSDQYTFRGSSDQTSAGAFVGYEYGIGKRRLRFTFGADLHVGYAHIGNSMRESWFTVNQTFDNATNAFSYTLQGFRDGFITANGHYVYLALSPRLGIRRDLGRRIALALTFTPQIGYSQRLGYNESLTGDRPYYFHMAKSMWYAKTNLDIRLIIKLGKS